MIYCQLYAQPFNENVLNFELLSPSSSIVKKNVSETVAEVLKR
jgi:hypothetical protein